jgi:LAGLIDADG endonuclease
MIKNTDLAYAAGYIDGDGCFYIEKFFIENRFKFRCFMVINSTEIENLQWFQKTFGGTLTSKHKPNPLHKPIHRLVIKSGNLEILKYIQPYLVEKIHEFQTFEKFRNPEFKLDRDELIEQMFMLKNHIDLIACSIKQQVESIRQTKEPSIEDFAYLAGWIDAECCLNINRSYHKGRPNPTYKILLQCNNTKSPCFYWLSERFGGQFHFIDRSHMKPAHRNQMCWRMCAGSLAQILPKIHPFLIHKKPVCEELMKFTKTIVPLKGTISRHSPNFSDFYRPILEERERIFHKIQTLNKKGK